MSRDRYKFVSNTPHFITCTAVRWLPLFSDPDTARIVINSLKFMQERERLLIFGYVLMENHLHLMASSPDLPKEIGDFKSFTAREIIGRYKNLKRASTLEQLHFYRATHKGDREYQVWQEGSHPKLISDEEMFSQKLDYMHFNPVKRGFVDDPVHWKYSSARNFAGMEAVLPIKRMNE